MANTNLRNLTNNFQDVRLASLAKTRMAAEITPCDQGGPYVVMQEGYDPSDPKVFAEDFVLGRSGKWLSLGLFFKMPIPERRAEFVFGTAAEVMQVMSSLPPAVQIHRPGALAEAEPATGEPDEMVAALAAGKTQPPETKG